MNQKKIGFSVASMVLGIIGVLSSCIAIGIVPSIVGLVFGIIVLKKKINGRGMAIAGIVTSGVGILIFIIMVFLVNPDGAEGKAAVEKIVESVPNSNDQVIDPEKNKEDDLNPEENAREPVKNVEVKKENAYGVIEDFSYELSGNKIFLGSYEGKDEIIEIKTSYTIDGIEYVTDISGFQIGIGNSRVKTLIIDEGFTEVNNAIFNSCSVQNVYFPGSMINVYDATLSYLTPEDSNVIKIYYSGSQEDWEQIFTEYKRTKVEDAEFGEELGTAIADKVNEMIGVEYDSSLFEFYFSANPDELK